MAEKIKIAELNIDTKQLLRELTDTKQAIIDLKSEQGKLRKEGKEATDQYVKNEAALKKLNGEYRDGIKTLDAVTASTSQLTSAIKKEVRSVDDAAKNNKELRKIRNQLNASTEEGAKKIEEINKKINKNTDFIKGNVSELENQKIGIGSYTESIKEALGGLGGFGKGLQGATGAMGGLTTSTLKFLATPVGVVLGVIAGAVLLVTNYLNRNEDAMDRLSKSTAFISGVFNSLLKTLEPLGEFLLEGLVAGLEAAEKAVTSALNAIQRGLEFLGFDEAAASVGNFTEQTQKAIEASKEIAELEKVARDSERNRNRLQLEFQKRQEELRQLRDDESLSLKERKQANEELRKSLEEQLKVETDLAQAGIRLAERRIELEGSSTENLDFLAEKREELADIEERINGQLSEQKTNINALRNEEQARADEAEARRKEQEEKQKEADEEELERIREFEDRKRELKDEIELANIEDEQEREELALEKEFRDHEAELERMELTATEREELALLLEDRKEQRLAELREKYRDAEMKAILDQQKKELDAIQKRENSAFQIAQQFASKTLGLLGDTLLARIAGIAVEAGLKIAQVKIQEGQTIAEITAATSSAVGKSIAASPLTFGQPWAGAALVSGAASIAKTKVATGKAIGQILGSAGIAAASNAISSIKFEKGGVLSGASHAQGGIPTPFGELEGGEAVINKRSTAMYAPLLSAINQAGGGRKFADGGILGQAQPSGSALIDYDRLAASFAALPNPVVSVEEVVDTANQVSVIETTASF